VPVVWEPPFAAESYDEAMPIYEYHCKQCGVFEVTQRIIESPLTNCPTCGGDVRRLISLTSFVLKGSGWYATDYARSKDKSESSESSGDSTSKEGAANGSSDKSASVSAESAKTSPAESSKSSSDKSASDKPAA
jgi:putative FmdB family regulatory protein